MLMQAWGLYTLVGGIVGGIFLRSFFIMPLPDVLLGAVILLALCMLIRLRREFLYQRVFIAALLLGLGMVLGIARLSIAENTFTVAESSVEYGVEVVESGVVIREPDMRANSQHLYVRTDDALLLVLVDRHLEVAYGDQVKVRGVITAPEVFTTDLGRTFSYPGYLKARQVSQQILFPDELVVEGSGEGAWLMSTLLGAKHYFQTSLRRVLPEPQVGLAEGLLLGEKRAMGEELTEAFRRAGIIHIVVLSGYNVLLVASFFLFVLSFFLPLRARVVGGVVAIVLFALLVGLSPTVTRASLMACLLLIASALGRQYAIMRALFFAGGVMLLINPYLLVYDPGFQLSFLATLGLIIVAPYLETALLQVQQLPTMKVLVVSTVATQLAVLPLLLYQIGEFSLVAVVVNVLVLPMVPVAMLLTFLAGMVAMVSTFLGSIIAYGAYLSLSYILVVATVSAALPFAALTVPPFPFWLVPVAYVGGAALLWWVTKPRDTPSLPDWHIEEEADVLLTSASAKPW